MTEKRGRKRDTGPGWLEQGSDAYAERRQRNFARDRAQRRQAAMDMLRAPAHQTLRDLRDAIGHAETAKRQVDEWVRQAKEEGYSWDIVGAILGVSPEAARERYPDIRSHSGRRKARPGKASEAEAATGLGETAARKLS
jgi:hypothetical protein